MGQPRSSCIIHHIYAMVDTGRHIPTSPEGLQKASGIILADVCIITCVCVMRWRNKPQKTIGYRDLNRLGKQNPWQLNVGCSGEDLPPTIPLQLLRVKNKIVQITENHWYKQDRNTQSQSLNACVEAFALRSAETFKHCCMCVSCWIYRVSRCLGPFLAYCRCTANIL